MEPTPANETTPEFDFRTFRRLGPLVIAVMAAIRCVVGSRLTGALGEVRT